MNKDLENLYIYKAQINLMYYSFQIMEKFPKKEKFSLCNDVKTTLYKMLENIILAQREKAIKQRIDYLLKIDVYIKILLVMIRIAFKSKYINNNNYAAWTRKITNTNNLLYGWLKSCQKQLKNAI